MIQDQQVNENSKSLKDIDEEDSIDLIAIAKTLWNGRKTIFISIGVCTILGFFVAISSPKEYTVSTVMVPQSGSDMSKSQLSGLASMAGINLGMTQSSELSPIIYPKIVNSTPFMLELMNTPITFSEFNKPISLFDYYTTYRKPSVIGIIKKYTLGLPGVIIMALKGEPKDLKINKIIKNQPISLSIKQNMVKSKMSQIISLEIEKKDGYLTLTVKMPEALAAAQLAQKAQELLQREIIKFKVEKSQADLNFIQERYNIAKAEAEKYQVNVAVNTDRFKNLTSSLPQVGTARIQTKYSIANNVFQELAKQLEQAKIQVKKDTPVFTIVEPVTIPSERSKPNRAMIIIFWIFFGGISGICIIYGKYYYTLFKVKWNESITHCISSK